MKELARPHMTVIIPTRERAQTLRETLKTCIAQDYDKFQIIVSDNCSEDDTAAVVKGFSDPRIRYIKTNMRLSMSRNWEFALSHVGEGFVTVIGDDDGLIPGSVTDAANILCRTNQEALAWYKAEYHWPDHPSASLRDKLLIPPDNILVRIQSKDALRDAVGLFLPYNKLPTLYNAFVSVQVIQNVKRRTSQFFRSVTPDIYSGFALLSAMESYLYSSRPFSINGASGKSNGTTAFFLNRIEGEAQRFLIENDIDQNAKIQVIPGSIYSSVAEAMLQANQFCFDSRLSVPYRRIFGMIARDISSLSVERRDEATKSAWLMAKRLGHEKTMARLLQSSSSESRTDIQKADQKASGLYMHGQVCFHGNRHGIVSISDAARFVGDVLNPYDMPDHMLSYSRWFLLVSERLRDFHVLARWTVAQRVLINFFCSIIPWATQHRRA